MAVNQKDFTLEEIAGLLAHGIYKIKSTNPAIEQSLRDLEKSDVASCLDGPGWGNVVYTQYSQGFVQFC